MFTGRKLWWAALLWLVLLLSTTSVALAQGGAGDKVVWGGNYTLAAGETLSGNLTVMGGNATLEPQSELKGNVLIVGGNLVAGGHIQGNITVVGGNASLKGTAIVEGSIAAFGGSIERAPGAIVRQAPNERELLPNIPGAPEAGPLPPLTRVWSPLAANPLRALLDLFIRFFVAIAMGLLLALIGCVVLLLAPKATAQVATTVARQPALNFATGLLTLVLAFLVGVPLLLACGLGLLVWLVAGLALFFGWIALGLWIGQRLLGAVGVRTASSLVEVGLGVFLMTWLAWVAPACLGWLLVVVLGSIGLGSVLLTRFGSQPAGFSGQAARGGPLAPAGSPGGGAPYSSPDPSKAQDVPVESRVGTEGQTADSGPGEASAKVGIMLNVGATRVAPARLPDSGPTASIGGWLVAEARSPAPGLREAKGDAPALAIGEGAEPAGLGDLVAVKGVTSEIAQRLRAAGSTTLVAIATSDAQTLASQAGVPRGRIEQEDWIGQARRLLG
jgi:predicted flap endonuclease-1-like 5' DNA nuclease